MVTQTEFHIQRFYKGNIYCRKDNALSFLMCVIVRKNGMNIGLLHVLCPYPSNCIGSCCHSYVLQIQTDIHRPEVTLSTSHLE